MFTEIMIFAAFYAVAFVAHVLHGYFARGEAHGAEVTHRFALVAAVVVKAAFAAFHEYAVHFVVYSGFVLPKH